MQAICVCFFIVFLKLERKLQFYNNLRTSRLHTDVSTGRCTLLLFASSYSDGRRNSFSNTFNRREVHMAVVVELMEVAPGAKST